MSTKSTKDPADNLHGEQDAHARFPINENPGGVYDERHKAPAGDPSDPRGEYDPQTTPMGDSSDPRGDKKKLSVEELSDREASDSSKDSKTEAESSEQSKLNGGLYSGTEKESGFSRLKITGRLNRKSVTGIAVGSVLAVFGISAFSILQGPLQFIHLAQNLQLHFKSNEDFGNDRTSKVLIYALAGKGAQNGRLGVTGNVAANKWEKKLLSDSGLRPIYADPGRKFVGFEIVDENKAQNFLGNIEEKGSGRNLAKVQKSLGKGAEIVDANNVTDKNGTKLNIVNSEGNVDPNAKVVNLAQQDYGDRRAWIKTVGRVTGTNNITGSLGSRLLIKRAGVNFHPMNKLKQATDEQVAKILDKRKKNIEDGVESTEDIGTKNTVDENGDDKPDKPDDLDVKASDDAKSFINDFKSSGVVKSGAGAAAIVGVLCAAKSYGKSVEDYKYTNNVLPMIRLGMNTITTGNQVQSGDDFNLETLKVMNQFMYDKEKKSSWNQAESIQAEQGKTGGKPIPPEADLRNATDKPKLFDILDSIGPLNVVCEIQAGIFGLPVLKQISGVVNDITSRGIDTALSLVGTSSDELIEASLKVVAGKSVDPNAKGADFGNFANTGAFLAANDSAIAMGGTALTSDERAQLKSIEKNEENIDKQSETLFARYFDPYKNTSLAASIIDNTPESSTQIAALFSNPSDSIFGLFSGLTSLFQKKAHAQIGSGGYDYGVPKYGFSVADQQDEKFENPYENAAIIEPQLSELNDRYGSCFGVKINADDEGVHIENGETVNVFKQSDDCKNNKDEMYLRYRFYIADAVTAITNACNADDERACAEIGAGRGTNTQPETTGDTVAGDAQMLKTITVKAGGEFITLPSRYSCPGRTTRIDARIAPALTYILTKYNLCADDGLANGHRSHGAGLGVDVRPKDQSRSNSKDEWKVTAEAAVRDMNWWGDAADAGRSGGCATYSGYGACVGGASGPNGKIPEWVRWLGYNGDVDHGDPWHIFGGSYAHIHIGWDTPNGDGVAPSIIGSPRSSVYTFPAPIPDDLKPLLPAVLLSGAP